MEAQKTMGQCGFDKLFTKSVPHILEKIFFSLDYASFKTCMEVNTVWHELLTSESLKRLGKSMFREDIERELWHAVGLGNEQEVRRVLSCGMVDVNCTDKNNCTPLLFAVEKGFKDVVQLLLEEGADARMANKGTFEYWSPLHVAASRGNNLYQEVAHLLLEGGAEPNMRDGFGRTPLHWASHPCVAKLLLDRGADLNIQCQLGYTPLTMAAMKGYIDVVKFLLESGADPNMANHYGETPLHMASLYGYKDITQILFDDGAEINMSTHTGHTPLGYATLGMIHTDIVNFLTENGGTE